MILRKFYRKRIDRSVEVGVFGRWNSLIEEEINKESISNYNISILKAVKKHVEDSGGCILFVDRPKFPISNLSKNEKPVNLWLWSHRIIKLLYNLRLISEVSFKKLARSYTNKFTAPPNEFTASPKKLRKNYIMNEDYEKNFVRVINGYRQGVEKEFAKNCNGIYLFGSSLVYRPRIGV